MAIDSSADRDLVVACMHHSGAQSGQVPNDIFWKVYETADGFGELSLDTLQGINDGYDWSHIRDSSPEAFASMAEILRKNGFELPAPAPRLA